MIEIMIIIIATVFGGLFGYGVMKAIDSIKQDNESGRRK